MEKRFTFNQVPKLYDSFRPTYVKELYDDIFKYSKNVKGSKALEIRIVTGQATKPFLEAGINITAIELGDNLAEYSKNKFSGYNNFEIINLDFMNSNYTDNSFDLVYSATAFHWLPEKEAYEKVFRLLKSGGTFARFRNHPYKDKNNVQMNIEIDKLYKEYWPKDSQRTYKEYSKTDAIKISDISKKYGFINQKCRLYKRTRTFNSKEYANLIKTYSDHIVLGDEKLTEFAKKISLVIDNYGGLINIYDTIDLQLCKKP